MNLHVQQSVHVLAAQTYCQIAVSGGGAVKGVRHLNNDSNISSNALNVEIIDEIAARDEKKNDISVDIRIAIARPYVLPFRTRLVYLYEGQHDIDLPSTRCQTRRD